MRVWIVYRHYDAHGEILYVGYTGRMAGRTEDHLRTAPWRDYVTQVHGTVYETEEEALDAEKHEIQRLKPPWNRKTTGDWIAAPPLTKEEKQRYWERTLERIKRARENRAWIEGEISRRQAARRAAEAIAQTRKEKAPNQGPSQERREAPLKKAYER